MSYKQSTPRLAPRISVSKLGEYLIAPPRRRRGIIRDQYQPRDAIVARYREGRIALQNFLLGKLDESGLREEMRRIGNSPTNGEWATIEQRLSISAIDRFLDMADDVELEGDAFQLPADRTRLVIAGVDISVRPDVVMVTDAGTRRGYGAVKLVLTRSVPLTDVTAAYIGTALVRHLQEQFPDGDIARDRCQVVDVMSGRIWKAPRAYKNKLADIEAGCEEIAQLWPQPAVQ